MAVWLGYYDPEIMTGNEKYHQGTPYHWFQLTAFILLTSYQITVKYQYYGCYQANIVALILNCEILSAIITLGLKVHVVQLYSI